MKSQNDLVYNKDGRRNPQVHDFYKKNPQSLVLMAIKGFKLDFRMEYGGDKEVNANVKNIDIHDFRYETHIDPIFRKIIGDYNLNVFEGDDTHTATFTEFGNQNLEEVGSFDIGLPDHPNLSRVQNPDDEEKKKANANTKKSGWLRKFFSKKQKPESKETKQPEHEKEDAAAARLDKSYEGGWAGWILHGLTKCCHRKKKVPGDMKQKKKESKKDKQKEKLDKKNNQNYNEIVTSEANY